MVVMLIVVVLCLLFSGFRLLGILLSSQVLNSLWVIGVVVELLQLLFLIVIVSVIIGFFVGVKLMNREWWCRCSGRFLGLMVVVLWWLMICVVLVLLVMVYGVLVVVCVLLLFGCMVFIMFLCIVCRLLVLGLIGLVGLVFMVVYLVLNLVCFCIIRCGVCSWLLLMFFILCISCSGVIFQLFCLMLMLIVLFGYQCFLCVLYLFCGDGRMLLILLVRLILVGVLKLQQFMYWLKCLMFMFSVSLQQYVLIDWVIDLCRLVQLCLLWLVLFQLCEVLGRQNMLVERILFLGLCMLLFRLVKLISGLMVEFGVMLFSIRWLNCGCEGLLLSVLKLVWEMLLMNRLGLQDGRLIIVRILLVCGFIVIVVFLKLLKVVIIVCCRLVLIDSCRLLLDWVVIWLMVWIV